MPFLCIKMRLEQICDDFISGGCVFLPEGDPAAADRAGQDGSEDHRPEAQDLHDFFLCGIAGSHAVDHRKKIGIKHKEALFCKNS